jgi:hypothetical protein
MKVFRKKLIIIVFIHFVDFIGFSQNDKKEIKIDYKKEIKPLLESSEIQKAVPLLSKYYKQNLVIGDIWHPKVIFLESNNMFTAERTLAVYYDEKSLSSLSLNLADSALFWYNRMRIDYHKDSVLAKNRILFFKNASSEFEKIKQQKINAENQKNEVIRLKLLEEENKKNEALRIKLLEEENKKNEVIRLNKIEEENKRTQAIKANENIRLASIQGIYYNSNGTILSISNVTQNGFEYFCELVSECGGGFKWGGKSKFTETDKAVSNSEDEFSSDVFYFENRLLKQFEPTLNNINNDCQRVFDVEFSKTKKTVPATKPVAKKTITNHAGNNNGIKTEIMTLISGASSDCTTIIFKNSIGKEVRAGEIPDVVEWVGDEYTEINETYCNKKYLITYTMKKYLCESSGDKKGSLEMKVSKMEVVK